MNHDLNPERPALSVVAQTPDYIVVNKPPGLITQGADSAGNLLAQVRQLFPGCPAYPVHRLDAATSGLVLVATTDAGNAQLSRCFRDQCVHKTYLALINRKPGKKQGTIIGDMAKSRDGNWILQRTRKNPAITRFQTVGLGNGLRLAILQPKTGKTHQLRVAMKAIGAPILGDIRYGGSPADRLYLHSWQLSIPWNDGCRQYLAPVNSGKEFESSQFLAALNNIESSMPTSIADLDK